MRDFFGQASSAPDGVLILKSNGDAVAIPDGALLFSADFERDGRDLVLHNDGAPDIRILDYFRTSHPADLLSPEGGILRGAVVERLAGPEGPRQYAQAVTPAGADPIGQVEKVDGAASVQRTDGVTEPLKPETKIFMGDVVQTGSDGGLSITFVDGTIFTLTSGSRMVIDELIYSDGGQNNSATFNLVQGGFIFIAGQVARTGGMDVNTPAATMGIRGTTVLVDVQTQNGVSTVEVILTRDPDSNLGRFQLYDNAGTLIATVTGTDSKWIVSTAEGETREVERTPDDERADNILIAEATAAWQTAFRRFNQGGNFVELDSVQRGTGGAPDIQNLDDTGNDGIDLDNQDDAPLPELTPAPAPDGPSELGPQRDGRNELQEPERNIRVTGLEDSEDAPIAGRLPAGGGTNVFTLVDRPLNGTVNLSPDGTYTYVPNPDYFGTDSFTYAVTIPGGGVEAGVVTVNILPVNDAPITENQDIEVTEDGSITGRTVGTDVDGDTLSYSLLTGAASGTVVVIRDGVWVYTPSPDFAGTDQFAIQVSDSDGATAVQIVSIRITGTNDAPVVTSAAADARGAVTETSAPAASGRLAAADADAGAVLTWSGSAAGAWGAFSIGADGAWSYVLTPAAAALAAGESVTERFTATVTDDQGASATETVVITVIGTNDNPVITTTANDVETDQEQGISGQLTATDADTGAVLSFSAGGNGPDHGVLAIAADGTWTYTPDAGFAGIDSFDYIVTDDQGAAVTGHITVAVNSVPQATDSGQIVTLNIQPTPSGLPAGSVMASASPISGAEVNLVITLDRSGSIGSAQWQTQINAVADALDVLRAQFAGSATHVEVQIITYANTARVEGTFDLDDPGLGTTLRTLPYSGGATNWTQTLQLTEAFFDAQPSSETNFLYFITDGGPSSNTWRPVFDRLTDEGIKGYSVNVEAFGIGGFIDLATLTILDDTPQQLSGPADLVNGFTETPLFSARLVDLSVNLIADGTDMGEVADETAATLVVSGFDTILSLADIDGLAELLGSQNRISVTGGFDLDGDPTTVELTLFASERFGVVDTARTIAGTDGSDLLFGSEEADTLTGNAGNDLILAFGGDDILTLGAGADTAMAGGGDDLITIASFEGLTGGRQESIDGGEGRDTLRITAPGDADSDYFQLVDLRGIEVLDIGNGQADELQLTISDLLDISGSDDDVLAGLLGATLGQSLAVLGDAGDSVTLTDEPGGQFVDTGLQVEAPDGTLLNVLRYSSGSDVLHTLAVDADVTVNIQTAAA